MPSDGKVPKPKMAVSEAIRRTMQGNRSKGSSPELHLRKALWSSGFRGYRVNVRKLPGTPDVVFGKQRVAIFVHGCFWHGCRNCSGYRLPKTNTAFWAAKLEENIARDRKAEEALVARGFKVLVLWECQIKENVDRCVELIAGAIEGVKEKR